jgi:hypothetical protein
MSYVVTGTTTRPPPAVTGAATRGRVHKISGVIVTDTIRTITA